MNPFANSWVMSVVIMTLYTINGLQFAVRGMWWDSLYWLAAFLITASVTFRPH